MDIICFDMDNTLLYSDKAHIMAFDRAFRKNGLPKVPARRIISFFGLVAKVFIPKIFPELSKREVDRVVADHDRFVIAETARYARIVPGAKRALKLLKGRYRLALLSNVKHKEIIALLRAVGIKPSTFDVLIGNDEVKHPKPAPDAVLVAMRRLRAKKGYVVGDTVYDVRAGKAAGLKTVAVLTGDQSRARLKAERPDYILKSVAGLPKILLLE